jgi:uncharacterized membrane protein YdfJ with MMPL/SSD domain
MAQTFADDKKKKEKKELVDEVVAAMRAGGADVAMAHTPLPTSNVPPLASVIAPAPTPTPAPVSVSVPPALVQQIGALQDELKAHKTSGQDLVNRVTGLEGDMREVKETLPKIMSQLQSMSQQQQQMSQQFTAVVAKVGAGGTTGSAVSAVATGGNGADFAGCLPGNHPAAATFSCPEY